MKKVRLIFGVSMKSFLLLAILLTIMPCCGFTQQQAVTVIDLRIKELERKQFMMGHKAYQSQMQSLLEQRNAAQERTIEMIANGVGSSEENVPVSTRPNRTVMPVSDIYIPTTRSASSIEETQSGSIGYQPFSGSNKKKQGGSFYTISEGVDSQTSYRNNDEAKRLEDQRRRDEWNAQEAKRRQDREIADKNRQIENRAFQLEGEIRNSRHSSHADYQGMATEASFLSQDARRAGNSGAAFHFDNAESKLNQISRDSDSFGRKSTFGSQDMDRNRRDAESSVWQGGSSIKH